MAVIYEVTVQVPASRGDEYLAWLRAHVADMLALPGFEDAALEALCDESPGARGWCVRYRLRDRTALDDYLREHAARMRGDGLARFGDGLRAQRRILSPLSL
ncbi:MAG: DUF4286 family protein [Proteobacteria bacterium]|nr:DUF4286 family protein [Pseudomonadota bacterium]